MPALPIDCFTRRFIWPKQAKKKYIALSYVWGPALPSERDEAHESNNSTSTAGNLPILSSKLPRVIDDAISVAKELSIRYLWVDKYCIDQKNEQLKAREISQMHYIYSGALLTIVVAAGGPTAANVDHSLAVHELGC
jgi:Heterokaryon incompatibility protein (HET)